MLNEMRKWSYHEKIIRENKELSNEDKDEILMGFYQIKRILGGDFLLYYSF